MTAPEPVKVTVTPQPTDDELAAIMAAYRALWPELPAPTGPSVSTRWKFSGRWWANVPARRRLR